MAEQIALGFGNNIDYEIVWNSDVVENLIVQHDIHDDELDINREIHSERDLLISILSFVKMGSGGERFVASSEIIEDLSRNFDKKITLGGTSIRAAIIMRKFGYTSAIHLVTLNDHVRQLMPQDSPFVCSNAEDSSYPHLIVQFSKSTVVKANDISICTDNADRIIYHSDDDNIAMNLNEDFSSLITDARVLLVAGFNAMQSEALLSDRLQTVLRMMEKLPEDAVVYYEDAGFYQPRFSQLILHTLADKITIFSLNQDELQAYLNRTVDLLNPLQIHQALAELHEMMPVPTIVVHSRYWACAYGEMASQLANALKAGVTMATTRFRYGDDFTTDDFKEIEKLPPDKQNTIVADAINNLPDNMICCVPVTTMEQSDATTVGLGDTFVGGFLPELLSIR